MTQAVRPSQQGFTLLEIIAILILGSILAAFLAPYITTSVSQSTAPLVNLKKTLSAYQTMEAISADYRAMLDNAYATGTSVDLTALQTKIGSGNQNNSYGTYTVQENKFIQFTGNAEQASGATTLLKVRITDSAGNAYTTLFTRK
ncbi:MAG: prepilin-type N-terminal cleavage/methylation domain-containing protein [Thermodesulfobacteriota bacterium]